METQDFKMGARKPGDYDVVVHIGMHKTGSSALQYFLLQNKDILEKYGYYYPVHNVNQNNISSGQSNLGLLLTKKDIAGTVLQLNQYIQQARTKRLTLLLSSEMIFPYCTEFKLAVEQLNLKIRILAFFRDPLERIYSMHGQVIKQDCQTLTLNDYCISIIDKSDFNYFSGAMILNWLTEFGSDNVDILPYDPVLLANQKIEAIFLDAIGVPASTWGEFTYPDVFINKSYTETAREFMRILNLVLDRSETGLQMNKIINVMLQKFSDNNFEPALGLHSLLKEEVYEKIYSLFSGTRQQVRKLIRAPMRDGWLSDQREGEEKGSRNLISYHQYSLGYIVESVFGERPDVINYTLKCTHEYIQRVGFTPDMIKLADALRIEVPMDQVTMERAQVIKERDQVIGERDQVIRERSQVIRERDQVIRERDQVIKERDQVIGERDQVIGERDQVIRERDQLLNSRSWKITKPLRLFKRLFG